ncbi:MAG: Fe-S cluster assembly protein SufD [Pseudohongiellaceae bacterium]
MSMGDFQQQALKLAARQPRGPDAEWLTDLRDNGARQWLRSAWPGRKTELWKYTPLKALQEKPFEDWAQPQSGWQDEIELLPIEGIRLVFVNGVFDEAQSDTLPEQVSLFSRTEGRGEEVLRSKLGTILDTERHLFAALSNAWANEGVLLHVPARTVLDRPIYIVHVSTPQAQPSVANLRVLVVMEQGARAEMIEHYVSAGRQQNGFVNALTEVSVGANAEFRHTRINLEDESLLHIGGVHVALQRDARCDSFTIAEGSQLKRIDYQVTHREPGGQLRLNGIYLAHGRQLLDYHTNIEHAAPHGTTEEVFRGIIGDHARAVFNGRIHIHPHAQKTLAELNNRNLLTSRNAEIDTKPELEIYADDVRCAHGATVSQLDGKAMYYLQSRGISAEQSRILLSFGFINELIQQLPREEIRDYLQRHLQLLFENSDSLIGEAGSQVPNEAVAEEAGGRH